MVSTDRCVHVWLVSGFLGFVATGCAGAEASDEDIGDPTLLAASTGGASSGGSAAFGGNPGGSMPGGTGSRANASGGAASGGAFPQSSGGFSQSSGGLPPASGGSDASGGSGASGGETGSGGAAGGGGTSGGGGAGNGGSGGASGAGGAAGGTAARCGTFPAVTDLAQPGPFGSVSAAEGPNCTVYHPTTLGQGGVKHPVILWANGTAGPTFVYGAAFDYWASHGFIVAAGNSSNGQGSGAEMLGCLTYLLDQNAASGSIYAGKVCPKVGASGHSQGGGGAIMAGQDPRLTATAPLMPYIQQGFGGFDQASIPKQTGPMLLLSGTADTIAAPAMNQKPVFDGTNVPVFWANLIGGDHVAVSLNGLATYREAMLAWYRLQLMDDQAFRTKFYGPSCVLCTDAAWQTQRRGIN